MRCCVILRLSLSPGSQPTCIVVALQLSAVAWDMKNAVVLVVGALLVALRQVEMLHWSKRDSASWQERQKEQRRVQRTRHCLLGKAIGHWRELQEAC